MLPSLVACVAALPCQRCACYIDHDAFEIGQGKHLGWVMSRNFPQLELFVYQSSEGSVLEHCSPWTPVRSQIRAEPFLDRFPDLGPPVLPSGRPDQRLSVALDAARALLAGAHVDAKQAAAAHSQLACAATLFLAVC
jgi:hypothetical protein